MHNIKHIRLQLGDSQAQLAQELNCTQANINHYEHGQTFPIKKAHLLIGYAKRKGVELCLEDIYPPPSEEKKCEQIKSVVDS